MKQRLLLVEDETDLGNVVKQYLEIMDFEVDWCTNALSALEKFSTGQYTCHLLLIDVSLPGMDGFELAQRLTAISAVPFLFLTARNEKKDRLHGLKIGADDYVVKPFDIDELVLRIRNIIRRNQPGMVPATPPGFVEIHDVRFYRELNQLFIGEETVTLTVREAELLDYLFRNANRILKREEILLQLWGENDFFLGRSLDVFISRLRKHLSKTDKISIKNVYGIGFVFSC